MAEAHSDVNRRVKLFLFQFCEVITVSWLKHLSGQVVLVLLDYLDHVTLCSKLKAAVMEQQQWPDICRLQGKLKYCP